MHAKSRDYIGEDHEYEGDEDILSLCDLQVSSKTNQASHHDGKFGPNKIEPQEISSSPVKFSPPRDDNQENLFEFFSEEWNIGDTNTTSPKITISKPVIPFPPPQTDHTELDDLVFRPKNSSNSKPPNPRTRNAVPGILPHPRHKIRSNSTRMTASSKANQPIITKSKSYSSVTRTSKFVEDQPKVSASPAKSKLLLVLFGLPPKIQRSQTMNDIKIRQSRHAPSTFFPSNSNGRGCRDDQDAVTPGQRRENRLWKIIKAVTCFRSQQREKMSFDA
ncbi:hypothetical protein ACET3Z_014125 [Daucus carota]